MNACLQLELDYTAADNDAAFAAATNAATYAAAAGVVGPGARTVAIVPCSAAKAPGIMNPATDTVHTAGTRYIGSFHTYARQQAARLGYDVVVLSAGYGLVPLDRPIPEYDIKLAADDSIAKNRGLLAVQAEARGLFEPGVTVVSFLPRQYENVLLSVVPAAETPLAGSRGIGEQRGRLAAIGRPL